MNGAPPDYHRPVLAAELVELLAPEPGQIAIDCTFGAGGHARLVAERIGPNGTLIAIDRDPSAASRFERFLATAPCETRFVATDFASALSELSAEGVRPDLVYLDLGVSSPQLDDPDRGFSYAHEAPLDMRMDPTRGRSAADLVNRLEGDRIAELLREFGEERSARSIAREIVARRPLQTTIDLVEAVRAAVPAAVRFGRGHPARLTFQALRIAVNDELAQIDAALPTAWDLLSPGGRLGAIAFHSLEDRRVKRFLAAAARGCICPPGLPVCVCANTPDAELITRRAFVASEHEVECNPRARSARLRVARKIDRDAEPIGEATRMRTWTRPETDEEH